MDEDIYVTVYCKGNAAFLFAYTPTSISEALKAVEKLRKDPEIDFDYLDQEIASRQIQLCRPLKASA